MAPSKKTASTEPEEAALPEEKEEPTPELADIPEIEAVAAAPGKKSLGVKEVIPFRWKLLGAADGLTLTLFKSVEREDSDAQLERLQKEGYYKDLRIVEADAKVEQSKLGKAVRDNAMKGKGQSKQERDEKKAERDRARAAAEERAAKARKPAPAAPAKASVVATKSEAKPARKKAAPSARPKRPTKKKR